MASQVMWYIIELGPEHSDVILIFNHLLIGASHMILILLYEVFLSDMVFLELLKCRFSEVVDLLIIIVVR